MTINPIDPHTTFPRSLLESKETQSRLDRPVIEQDLLLLEDKKKREDHLHMPLATQKAQDKILRDKEREEKRRREREKRENDKQGEKEVQKRGPSLKEERGQMFDQRI